MKNKNKGNVTLLLVIPLTLVLVLSITGIYLLKKQPKSVDYYKEHKVELEQVHKQCINNPAELKDSGDCINSQEAKTQLIFEKGRANLKSINDSTVKGF